eukprot:Skav217164  [mRNA]  locus=scaffold566:197158:197451:- [translate_table: standard]
MALGKMSTADLKARLWEMHGEPTPKGWRKNRLLLRLTELEGIEAAQPSGPPKKSPLRELEIRINKSARRTEPEDDRLGEGHQGGEAQDESLRGSRRQ